MCYSVTNNMDDKIKDKQVIHKETDIVDFVEEFLGVKLFDSQKQMLKYSQKYPDAKIIMHPLRGRSSRSLMILLIAKAIFESQKEEREDKNDV